MGRIYLTEFTCKTIKEARIRKGITNRDLARIVGKTPAWLSKIELGQLRSISIDDAKKFEEILDITVPDYAADTNAELLQKIEELMEENRRLKELLMEKWKS